MGLRGTRQQGSGEKYKMNSFSSTNRSSVNKIEKNGMGGTCSVYGERWGEHRVLVEKDEG